MTSPEVGSMRRKIERPVVGLTASGLTYDTEGLSTFQSEVHVIDRMEQSLWSVEIFFQVFYFKDRICHYCSLLSMENPGSS